MITSESDLEQALIDHYRKQDPVKALLERGELSRICTVVWDLLEEQLLAPPSHSQELRDLNKLVDDYQIKLSKIRKIVNNV